MREGTAKLPAHAAVRHGQSLPGAAGGRGLRSPLIPCPGAGKPWGRAGRREAAAPAAGSAHAPAPGERSRRPLAGRSPARSEVHANRRIIPPERGGGGGGGGGGGLRTGIAARGAMQDGCPGAAPGARARPGRYAPGRGRAAEGWPCRPPPARPPQVPWAARRRWRRPGRRRTDGARGRWAARPAEGAAGGRAPTGTPGRNQHRPRPRPAAAAARGPAAPPGGARLRRSGRRQRGRRAGGGEGGENRRSCRAA